jgi:hypothetical protein
VTLRADLPALIVQPGQAEETRVVGSTAVSPVATDVKALSDALPLLHRQPLSGKEQTITNSLIYNLVGTSILSWLSYALLVFYTGKTQRQNAATILRQQAWRQFKSGMQPLLATPTAAGAEQGFRMFREYVGHKLGIAGTAMSGTELLKRLESKQEWHGVRDALTPGIKRLEAAEYGGTSLNDQAAGEWLSTLMTAAEEFERTC